MDGHKELTDSGRRDWSKYSCGSSSTPWVDLQVFSEIWRMSNPLSSHPCSSNMSSRGSDFTVAGLSGHALSRYRSGNTIHSSLFSRIFTGHPDWNFSHRKCFGWSGNYTDRIRCHDQCDAKRWLSIVTVRWHDFCLVFHSVIEHTPKGKGSP